MMKTKDYISPELDLRLLSGGTVLCTSDTFDSEQNEGITENEYTW